MLASLLAVVVSGLAVYWVKKTLEVTRGMARDTREMGERQIRAYLAVENVSVFVGPEFIKIAWEIKNIGHSPAQHVKVLGAWAGEIGEFSDTWLNEIKETPLGSIAPGGRVQNVRMTNESIRPDSSLSVPSRMIT